MPLGTLIEPGPMAVIELGTPCVLIDRFQASLKRQLRSSEETGPPFKCGVLGVEQGLGRELAGKSCKLMEPDAL
jgi:hypothetical protein